MENHSFSQKFLNAYFVLGCKTLKVHWQGREAAASSAPPPLIPWSLQANKRDRW